MGPLILKLITGLLLAAAGPVVIWLSVKGILTQDESTQLLTTLAGVLLTIGAALWQKYRERVNVLTALSLPKGSSEKTLDATVKAKDTPPVTTPPTSSPVRPSQDRDQP